MIGLKLHWFPYCHGWVRWMAADTKHEAVAVQNPTLRVFPRRNRVSLGRLVLPVFDHREPLGVSRRLPLGPLIKAKNEIQAREEESVWVGSR
jgi:hypothetical protein